MTNSISIHIIGLGVAEKAELTAEAKQALAEAQWVIGSNRQIDIVESLLVDQQTLELPKLSELKKWLEKQQALDVQSIVVLASGDPLYYGIGRWFGNHFDISQLTFYPGISSIQSACHELGLSLQDVDVLSLHGRPVQQIRKNIKCNQNLLLLTDWKSQPQVLAQECIDAGLETSLISVCENLGYAHQQIRHFNVQELIDNNIEFDPLHVSILQTNGPGGVLPEFPGIPDENFITGAEPGKGLITKREVRLAILSLMQPANKDIIWDIGAGCGSVAVELAYWNKSCQVYAVEKHPERLSCLKANTERFGVVSQLKVVEGRAPTVLDELPKANKVFIGGSDGELPELLNQVWQGLPDHGVLVSSAVTENTKQILINFLQTRQECQDANYETLQIAVSKGGSLAGQLVYRPGLPVSLFQFIKRSLIKAEQGPKTICQA